MPNICDKMNIILVNWLGGTAVNSLFNCSPFCIANAESAWPANLQTFASKIVLAATVCASGTVAGRFNPTEVDVDVDATNADVAAGNIGILANINGAAINVGGGLLLSIFSKCGFNGISTMGRSLVAPNNDMAASAASTGGIDGNRLLRYATNKSTSGPVADGIGFNNGKHIDVNGVDGVDGVGGPIRFGISNAIITSSSSSNIYSLIVDIFVDAH